MGGDFRVEQAGAEQRYDAGGSLYFLAENSALKFSTASNVAILVGTAPLITALIVA